MDLAAEPAQAEQVLQHGPVAPPWPGVAAIMPLTMTLGALTSARPIVIAGSLAQRPHHGGHTWVFLQYLLGFRRLGWDVLFVDRLEPGMCVDAAGAPGRVRVVGEPRPTWPR